MFNIRADFSSVAEEFSRLFEYAKVYEKYDEDWSHYCNREDFNNIYTLNFEHKNIFEKLYAHGRDMAMYLSSQLYMMNDVSKNPTLSSAINSFSPNCWLYDVESLQKILDNARTANKQYNLWSVNQMALLFEQQLALNENVKQVFSLLKESNLYKKEHGIPLQTNNDHITSHEDIFKNPINFIFKKFPLLQSLFKNKIIKWSLGILFLISIVASFVVETTNDLSTILNLFDSTHSITKEHNNKDLHIL